MSDRELCIAIKNVIRVNMPSKYGQLEKMEREIGPNVGVIDYQMWIENNIALDSYDAATIYSVAYEKPISDVIDLMNSRRQRK